MAASRPCQCAGLKIRPLTLFKSFFFVFIKIHTLAKCMAHWAVHKTHTSLQHQILTIQKKLLLKEVLCDVKNPVSNTNQICVRACF